MPLQSTYTDTTKANGAAEEVFQGLADLCNTHSETRGAHQKKLL